MQKIEEVILFQVEQASKAAKIYSQKEFDRLGIAITVEQWILLKIISESSDLTQKELAVKSSRRSGINYAYLRFIGEKGIYTKKRGIESRRSYAIELTNEGKKFVNDTLKIVVKHRKKCFWFL